MDNQPATKADTINQLVRAVCVILLLVTFCGAYAWGVFRDRPIVDSAAFIGVLTLALTWFFKSRDEQQQAQRGTTTTPATTPIDTQKPGGTP